MISMMVEDSYRICLTVSSLVGPGVIDVVVRGGSYEEGGGYAELGGWDGN